MDAGSISMMKLAEVQTDWSIGFAANVKEVMEQQGEALTEMMQQTTAMMERSVTGTGLNIDIRV